MIRPISTPLATYMKLGLSFVMRYLKNIMDNRDEDAARKVVRTTTSTSGPNARVLPGLKPNHPSHRRSTASINHPGVTFVGICGLIFRPFFFSSLQI